MEMEAALDEIAAAIEERDVTRISSATASAVELIAAEPQAFVNRLVSGREHLPGVAMPMLFDATGDAAPTYLRRIIKARDAADLIRFEAQRLLGFEPEREIQHRRGFLASLHDPEGTLADISFAVGVTWPSRLFLGEDVLRFIDVMKPDQQIRTLHRIVARCGAHAIPMLHALLHDDNDQTAIAAIQALSEYRFAGSLGPLKRVARLSEHAEARQAAANAMESTAFDQQRLEPPDAEIPPFPPQPLAPPDRCAVSAVLPSGEQTVSVIREMAEGLYGGFGYVTDDVNGIADVFVFSPGTWEMMDGEIEIVTGAEVPTLEVNAAVVRGAVEMALTTIEQIGLPLAPTFELWEPLIHDTYPPPPDEPFTLPIIDDAPFADRKDLADQAESLFDSTFFSGWSLEPVSMLLMGAQLDLTNPDEWSAEQYEQIIGAVAQPELIGMLRRRLQQQAYLLDLDDEEITRDIALAVSASLAEASQEDLVASPFLRQMAKGTAELLANPFGLGLLAGDTPMADVLRQMADPEGLDLSDLDLDSLDLSDLDLNLDELDFDEEGEDDTPP
jgi:hypothetical protein